MTPLRDVMQLRGSAPDSWMPNPPGHPLCVWKLESRTLPGVPPAGESHIRGRVWTTITCRLPTGGRPSASGSCAVQTSV